MLHRSTQNVNQNRYQSVLELTQKFGAVAVLKGPGTLVAFEENIWVCQDGNPGMATAGMGDVLSGVLGALLAQGIRTTMATLYGVCLHSHAADVASQENGQIGLLAGDLFPYLRQLINADTNL